MSKDSPTWIIEVYLASGQPDLERRISELAATLGGRFDYRWGNVGNSNLDNPGGVELTYEFDDLAAAQLGMDRIKALVGVHVEGPSQYS